MRLSGRHLASIFGANISGSFLCVGEAHHHALGTNHRRRRRRFFTFMLSSIRPGIYKEKKIERER